MRQVFILAILLLLLSACGQSAPTQAMSPEATAYLEHALGLMQQRSLNRHRIDWTHFRWRLFKIAEGAQTSADTHSAIRFMVGQLGDGHSAFLPPAGAAEPEADQNQPLPRSELVAGRIGYLSLPYLLGDGPHADAYAAGLHAQIRDLDAQGPCGWIVDLSENQGGNMWPMLAGIGPVLGEGEAGRFVDPDGVITSWSYRDGAALLETTPMARVQQPYTLKQAAAPVAVITGERTASSGEAIAVAFRQRPSARSFGAATAGLSTGNETHQLSDGATLVLTEVVMGDRTGGVYGGALDPDEPTGWFGPSGRERAQAWLLDQPACR
ncbi:MAG TPA: S41 family peptidase [Roseiflexaceae bacterium]|nr:S41 family peptidase [Roseiflexaceae bacterium]